MLQRILLLLTILQILVYLIVKARLFNAVMSNRAPWFYEEVIPIIDSYQRQESIRDYVSIYFYGTFSHLISFAIPGYGLFLLIPIIILTNDSLREGHAEEATLNIMTNDLKNKK